MKIRYEDSALASSSQCKGMNREWDIVRVQEYEELRDIHSQMVEQCKRMESLNTDGRFRNAIDTIKGNIRDIERILGKGERMRTARVNNTETRDGDVYGKVPHEDEMMRVEEYNSSTTPNNNSNANNNSNNGNNYNNGGANHNNPEQFPSTGRPDIAPPDTSRPGTDINTPNIDRPSSNNANRRQVFPMQSSFISNIARTLFMRNQPRKHDDRDDCNHTWIYPSRPPYNPYRQPFMKSRVNEGGGHPWHYLSNCADCDRDSDYMKHDHRFKPHRPHDNWIYDGKGFPHHDDRCDPHRKVVTGQINLLRLLLLFVATRPRCDYMPQICTIADNQFGVLLELI